MGAGASWKTRREEMGKTLEDVAQELRISRKYLQGIEEGVYVRWPAKVFSTGFIRAYATLLSMDAEPVLTEYYDFLETQAVEEPAFEAKPEWLERERRRGTRRRAYTIAAGAVLALGLFLAWYSRHTGPRPPSAPEVREAPPVTAAVPAPAGNAALPPPEAAERGAGTAQPPSDPARKTLTAVGGSGTVSAPYQLFLEASELTWVMYSRDGSEPVDVMLYPGDRMSIQAQRKVYLKIGNAGGVVGTLNGTLLPPFGQKGQVKEITLGE